MIKKKTDKTKMIKRENKELKDANVKWKKYVSVVKRDARDDFIEKLIRDNCGDVDMASISGRQLKTMIGYVVHELEESVSEWIENWADENLEECSCCSKSVGSMDANKCPDCGDTFCGECGSTCDKCGSLICDSCEDDHKDGCGG